jgi:dihydroneopterin aldolase
LTPLCGAQYTARFSGLRVTDRIFIEGIKFHGFHGLTRMEREVGVRLSVDVVLEVSLDGSGNSDELEQTLDYRKVHQRVIEIGRGRSHRLLESFGLTLLKTLLHEFPADRVTVRVRKETPVLDGIVDSVGVELTRSRQELADS